jgi:N-ethylmaleimide reductase
MPEAKLFTPVILGGKKNPLTLKHRVVMAPLSRFKADVDAVQPEIAALYYSQRATDGGLIIAEATDISPTAHGYDGAPGVHSQAQVEAWKKVTEAVHAKNGKIFLQIWHTGRVGHPLNQPNGELPVSSSTNLETNTERRVPTPDGRKPYVQPRALETDEIPAIVQDYKNAAKNAIIAGFDGVEIHGANGYLIEQFLHDGINDRTDKYGGSVENRARFLFEVVEAVLEAVDSSRVGLRLSPFSMVLGQFDSDPVKSYGYVLKKLSDYDLAYAHVIEPRGFPVHENPGAPAGGIVHIFRPLYEGVLMAASGYDRELAVKVVEDDDADLVAIGRYFISNPDLVKRFKLDAPLNPYDSSTFYTHGAEGYIDQPFLTDN